MFDAFGLPFFHDALLQIALLSVAGGLLGTWIVLRGLAFYAHAVAAASFPGLVLAGGLGFAAPLGALAAGALFAASVGRLSAREEGQAYDSLTALVLVAALAGGVLLASDVFHSGSNVDSLLFGSLLLIDGPDQVLSAVAALLAVGGTLALGPRWLASGFDPGAARALGVRSGRTDFVLLALVALGAVATLAAAGALLAGALLVMPAATARLWTRRLRTWQLASVALALGEGVVGLWLSVELNAPPGAAIAVLAGGVFALAPLAPLVARRRAVAAAATGALLLLPGCGGVADGSGRPLVVATTTQAGELARAVAGRAAQVHQVLRPNTDPHEYEPRPRDVTAVADARLVIRSGAGLDDWTAKIVSASGSGARVLELAAAIGADGAGGAGEQDPHWWHDPRQAIAAVERIRDAMGAAFPARHTAFDRNARAYIGRLRALDRALAACIGSVPRRERKLVTSHDSFGWFARRYGIRVVGAVVPSQSTEAEPSAGDVAELARQVQREHVRAVFVESSANPKLGEAVARETGAIGDLRLYGDTLGPPGSPGATYIGMERANADAMVRGFTGGRRGCR